MTREEYQNLYETEQDISMPDEFIREWIDRIADAMNMAKESGFDLHYGNLDKIRGKYEYNIEPCAMAPFKEYHIYRGIDKLAEVCGEELLKVVDEDDERYPVTRYFYYKGIKFFELRSIEDNGDLKP